MGKRSLQRSAMRLALTTLVLASFTFDWLVLWRSTASDLGQLAPDALVVVSLKRLGAEEAARLVAALPEWAEAIQARTHEVTVGRQQYLDLRAQGYDVDLVGPAAAEPVAAWPDCYSTLDELYAWITAYAQVHPDLIEIYDIGDSFCKQRGGCMTPGGDVIAGRDILVARITNERATSPKQGRLWIDGGLHARELPTVELVKAFITQLVEGYGQDPQITYLLDHRELYAGICSNPDGRLLVEMGTNPPYNRAPWLWRKNGNDMAGACDWPPLGENTYGVDLNRNHMFKWDAPGHSEDPCQETYRGRSPASEPEIQAYEAFVRSIFPDQRGPRDTDPASAETTGVLINFHNATMPGTVLMPWGWTESKPPNDAELSAIARRYASFNRYRTQNALYPVSGNTRDWGYGELGIPSYVIELQGRQFITPCDELPGVIQSHLAPLQVMLDLCDRPYIRINGPETTAVQAPRAVRQGDLVTIRARLDETRAGGQAIAGAEVLIGRPGGPGAGAVYPDPGKPTGQGIAMSPADGAFNGPVENAVLQLDTAGLAPGRYYIVVRGRDVNGYWGAGVATFLDVGPRR